MDELLFAIPGVALANRQNPAQDPRVSIRGFGARSAFGVRGVRVLQDGVPVTLPDGQTPVDVLDVEGAARVEVTRGSASSLYGNAAGGVIDLHSATPPPENIAPYGRITGGADTPTLTAAGAAGTVGSFGYTSSVTRVNGAGYRNYSDQRGTHGAVRLTRAPPDGSAGTTVAVAARVTDVSRAQSPGAITQAQMDADPRQADALSVRKQAGKVVRQGDLSLSAAHPLGGERLRRRRFLWERPHAGKPAHLCHGRRRPDERRRVGAGERRHGHRVRGRCVSPAARMSSGSTTTGMSARTASTRPRCRPPAPPARRCAVRCARISSSS